MQFIPTKTRRNVTDGAMIRRDILMRIHRPLTLWTIYTHVISTRGLPFEKYSPMWDKLIRYRLGCHIALKLGNALSECGVFCLECSRLLIESLLVLQQERDALSQNRINGCAS